MALTLDKEQRLKDADLIPFFDKEFEMWSSVARRAYNFAKADFPTDSIIRPDDLLKPLLSVVEVNEELRAFLNENKLRGKIWKDLFVDLIVDRTWYLVSGANDEKK